MKTGASSTARGIPRCAFWLDLLFAAGLLSAVLVSPYVPADYAEGQAGRLVTVFAQDSAVRQTSLAAALGLMVTAWVFFVPGATRTAAAPRPPRTSGPTHSTVVGA